MRELSCKEAGAENCNFVARGDTDDDVMRQVRDHAQSAHNRPMTKDEENQTRSLIHSA